MLTAFYTDLLIFLFLVADFFVLLWCMKRLRGFGRVFVIVLASAAWLVIFYGSFIEPQLIITTNQAIKLGASVSATSTLRAAVLSDFHVGPYKKEPYLRRVVATTMAQHPDIVFILGDNIFDDISYIKYLSPLKDLKAPLGVFAVLGNHDYGEIGYLRGETMETRARAVRETLENFDIKVLINQGTKVQAGGKDFYLLGLDEIWTGRASLPKALKNLETIEAPHPSILLAHNADIVREAEKYGIDLVVAGHTHGGQIRLPLIGSVPKIPHRLGNKYDRGLFSFGKTRLFITSGVGESGPRARLFVPPEVAMLEIQF